MLLPTIFTYKPVLQLYTNWSANQLKITV